MSLAHLTLATPFVERTAAFLERMLGYRRNRPPDNSPTDVVWLDIGRGQELHVIFVEGFVASPFEEEFGRHIAVFHPLADFPALKARLTEAGATLIAPLRPTPFERFFFREPINGYLFEVVDAARDRQSGQRADMIKKN
jgi:catechol 2,3-dioxygenase-like lactoylglutathione lyase family enzyme